MTNKQLYIRLFNKSTEVQKNIDSDFIKIVVFFNEKLRFKCKYICMCFKRIQMADERYKIQFKEELQNLKIKIVQRAQDKLDATVREIEESERQKRLGPGGLDPVEVYESLPSVNSFLLE